MNINLLPWREEIITYNRKIFIRMVWVALIASGIFLIAIYHLLFGQVIYTKSYMQALEEAKTSLVNNVSAYLNYKKTQKEISARYVVLQRLQFSRFETIGLLNELAKVTPKGVYLDKLIRKDSQVDIFGSANSNLLIAQMMQAIEVSKTIKVVSLQKVEKSEGDNQVITQFELKLMLIMPTSLSDTSAKNAEKNSLTNPIDVINKHKEEQNQLINAAVKKG
jgi:type IV pilus assembly protein PilN